MSLIARKDVSWQRYASQMSLIGRRASGDTRVTVKGILAEPWTGAERTPVPIKDGLETVCPLSIWLRRPLSVLRHPVWEEKEEEEEEEGELEDDEEEE